MAIIPIKVLKDKNQVAFLPFTITDAVFVADSDKTLTEVLDEQIVRIDEAVESIPTKTSDLVNDSGFITNTDIPTKTSDLTNDSGFIADANYVHTDNNYTDNEKNKLSGITAGAEVNVLEKIKVNGVEQTITNKAVDIFVPTKVSDIINDLAFIDNTVNNLVNYYTKTEVDNKISSVYKYKGSVNTYADLPSSGQITGDVYNVVTADVTHGVPAGGNVAWNGTAWDYLGGDVDLSNYYTKAQVDTSLNGKVDKVTGKQLSTEDYTSAEKTKLSNIEANAEINLIESISVNNITVSPVNKNVNITVPTTLASLTDDATHRTVSDTDIDSWNAKQDELVSGVNIRTVNGNSLLGSGDIAISGGSSEVTLITENTNLFNLDSGIYKVDSASTGAELYIPITSSFVLANAIDETNQASANTYIRVSDVALIVVDKAYTAGIKAWSFVTIIPSIDCAYQEKWNSSSQLKEYDPDHAYNNILKVSNSTPNIKYYDIIEMYQTDTGFDYTSITGYSASTANQFLTHDTSGNLMWATIPVAAQSTIGGVKAYVDSNGDLQISTQ